MDAPLMARKMESPDPLLTRVRTGTRDGLFLGGCACGLEWVEEGGLFPGEKFSRGGEWPNLVNRSIPSLIVNKKNLSPGICAT
jgi:hypothetical protein